MNMRQTPDQSTLVGAHRKKIIWASGAGLIALVALSVFMLGKSMVGAAPQVTYYTSGSQIYDTKGNPVTLRGANIESSLIYTKGWQQGNDPLAPYSDRTLQVMNQDWHMNVLRMSVSRSIYNMDKRKYLNDVTTIVKRANTNNLFVIIALHDDNKSGTTLTSGTPNALEVPFWQDFANAFKAYPMVGYDLINEPHFVNGGKGKADWDEWLNGGAQVSNSAGGSVKEVGLKQLVQAIRGISPSQPIVVEPGDASGGGSPEESGWGNFPIDDAIASPNIIYSLHEYQGVTYSDSIQNSKWGPLHGKYPLYYGEWAVLPNTYTEAQCKPYTPQNVDQYTNNFMAYAKDIGASWTAWAFDVPHMIADTSNYTPTQMGPSTHWTCPASPKDAIGMGQDVKNFLVSNTKQSKLTILIARGDSEIKRRLEVLNGLQKELDANTTLTAADKTELKAEVSAEINGLTALNSKLDAENNIQAASRDVDAIKTEYRTFAFLNPKVAIITTADAQLTTEANLTKLADKLKARIPVGQTKLLAYLDDMYKQIAAAKALSSSVEKDVLALKVSDYNQNHNLFAPYLDKLKQAQNDDTAAAADAKNIVDGLKSSPYPYVSGTHIYDSSGNVVTLRGAMIETSLAYIKPWEAGQDPAKILNAATFNAMTSTWHMNAVRINMSQWIAEKDPTKYYQKLDTIVQQATGDGMYVVLDFHDDGQSGSPYNDGMLHPESLAWWKQVASRYMSNPHVLYDLINEPHYTNWTLWLNGGTSNQGKTVVGFKDAVNAIRSSGSQQLIVVEPGQASGGSSPQDNGWNGYNELLTSLDSNIIYSKHDYKFITQEQLKNPTNYTKDFDSEWGTVLGKHPLFYGEWNVNPHPQAAKVNQCKGLTSSNADGIVKNFLTYLKDRGASWTAWDFLPYEVVQDTGPTFTPTTFNVGKSWVCGDAAAAHAGMGTVIKQFLEANP
jgi:hypothetical protein